MNKNSFALRPPMGWNSYDYYDTNVTEADVLKNAEFMAKHLKPYGWEYIVVDIQWYAWNTASMRDKFQYIPFGKNEMDAYGRLLPCPEKFPSSANGAGFKPLADKIHDLGLKFGIHIMRGIPRLAAHHHMPILGTDVTADMVAEPASVAEWNPDMYGILNCKAGQTYYDSILELYASWGVDFIKVDDICSTGFYPHRGYGRKHEVEMLHRAIEKCGRPVVLSLSPGPATVEESWHYSRYANMWRITDDFWDNWETLLYMFDRCEKWQDHVHPGCWPDCDMLPLGRVGMFRITICICGTVTYTTTISAPVPRVRLPTTICFTITLSSSRGISKKREYSSTRSVTPGCSRASAYPCETLTVRRKRWLALVMKREAFLRL